MTSLTDPIPMPGDPHAIPLPPMQAPTAPRSRGFPNATAAEGIRSPRSARGSSQPTPLPHRPKGMWFSTLLMVGVIVLLGSSFWRVFLRDAAVGQIEGRVIHVAPPWLGTVQTWHVREGDQVQQGQLLATISNAELEYRLARAKDELHLAQAELQARMSAWQWQTDVHGDGSKKALADYYALWGELLREESKLEELTDQSTRATRLEATGAVSTEQSRSLRLAEQGQRANVEKLRDAVKELKDRSERAAELKQSSQSQTLPEAIRIETLSREISRLRMRLEQGQIRAPVGGQVVQRHVFTGETVSESQILAEVCEAGTLDLVLYVEEKDAANYPIGSQVTLELGGGGPAVNCEVTRRGQRFVTPPAALRKCFRAHAQVLAIHCRPQTPLEARVDDNSSWSLGQTVRMRRGWWFGTSKGKESS